CASCSSGAFRRRLQVPMVSSDTLGPWTSTRIFACGSGQSRMRLHPRCQGRCATRSRRSACCGWPLNARCCAGGGYRHDERRPGSRLESQMTEKLFLDDPRLNTAPATVLASGPDGIVLDRTVFYARSGGQPGDVGVLRWDGGETPIVDTVKGDGETV